jgi:hypothetical protein
VSSTADPRGITRIAAATLAAFALAAPAAAAMPIDPPTKPPTQRDLSALDATPAAPRVVVRATDESFDWGAAGIGAAASGLVLVAAGGLAAAHRARTRLAQ